MWKQLSPITMWKQSFGFSQLSMMELFAKIVNTNYVLKIRKIMEF